MNRTINVAGFQLIKRFESLRLKAYPDPGTGDVPFTIGWGSTFPPVHKGDVITLGQATDRLMTNLRRFEDFVTEHAGACTDNQYAALVSFAFNCGTSNLEESTLLRYHRAGKYDSAKAEFLKWTNANGRSMPGLVKRRAAESALYGAP